jgi:hypothetical protein
MLIGFRHNNCIFCGKPFFVAGFQRRAGEVDRSDEHIIPANIFGRLKTNDVCKDCNSQLGSDVDHRLLNDFHIFHAGLDTGYKPEQLLPSFRVCGNTPDGEHFEYQVRNGRWRLKPSFHETGFKIGAIDGSSTSIDLENAKRKMLRIVQDDKRLPVSPSVAEQFIEELFDKFLKRQAEYTIYQEQIKQGLRARPIPTKGSITITTHPWETQWAVAKILYEVGHTMLPEYLRRAINSALQQLRLFLNERKLKVGIFQHKTLNLSSEKLHEVQILLHGSKLRFSCRLFKREQWSVTFDVLRYHLPARLKDYELVVINYCNPSTAVPVQVLENGITEDGTLTV